MQNKNNLFLRQIVKTWGNRIALFLFLLNLVTNWTVSLIPLYRTFQFTCYWIVISAMFATIETALYYLLKKIHLHNLFLIFIVFLHVSLCIVDVFLYLNFNFILGQDAIDIIAQTTSTEAKSFLRTYVSTPFIICMIILLIGLFWAIKKVASKLSQRKIPAFAFMILSLSGFLLYIVTTANYVLYHNGQSIPQLHSFTRTAYSSTILLKRHNQIVTLRKLNRTIKASMPSNYVNTIIVIIGESFSSYHSSLYGYCKETNPYLAKRANDGSLTTFTDVATFSDHTETVMCTVFPLNRQPNLFFTDVLFPVCFKAAGYNTIMVDNQYFVGNGITFLTDNELSGLMFDDRNTHGYQYDGEMLKDIQLKDGPQLIVMHLQGQHYTFADRYPKQFARFSPKDYLNLTEEQKEIAAHYDNATIYNDYVIEQIIKSVEDKDCLIVYFSDHGEEIYELDDYMGHGNAVFRPDPTYQVRVPLFIWTSNAFCEKHSDKAKRIKDSADKPIITSDLPHFLIDVADINTEHFNADQSFINDHYKQRNRIILNSEDYEKIKNQPRIKSRY